ncbi:MAG: MoaD/ThiS family protein [Actinomycetales bacterium]|nr:MoaD/ThiS family protein [Actinomycetales bacterium]
MSVRVRIPTILRNCTGGQAEVQAAGATVSDVLEDLERTYPGIRARVLDDDGELRRFVNVYVDEDDVRFLQGLSTPVPAGCALAIIPAVAGGRW